MSESEAERIARLARERSAARADHASEHAHKREAAEADRAESRAQTQDAFEGAHEEWSAERARIIAARIQRAYLRRAKEQEKVLVNFLKAGGLAGGALQAFEKSWRQSLTTQHVILTRNRQGGAKSMRIVSPLTGGRTFHFAYSSVSAKADPHASKSAAHMDYLVRPGAIEVSKSDTGDRAPMVSYDALQDYLEDAMKLEIAPDIDGTIHYAWGTIGDTKEQRRRFWQLGFQHRERKTARLQHRLIIELPHNASPAARYRIMKEFCSTEFEQKGLPYFCALHAPTQKNDKRNFHAHLTYMTRPCQLISDPNGSGELVWDFAAVTKKLDKHGNRRARYLHRQRILEECRSINFIEDLRAKFASIVNKVATEEGLSVRFDQRSHKDMGIDIKPTWGVSGAKMKRMLENRAILTKKETHHLAERHSYEHFRPLWEEPGGGGLVTAEQWQRLVELADNVPGHLTPSERLTPPEARALAPLETEIQKIVLGEQIKLTHAATEPSAVRELKAALELAALHSPKERMRERSAVQLARFPSDANCVALHGALEAVLDGPITIPAPDRAAPANDCGANDISIEPSEKAGPKIALSSGREDEDDEDRARARRRKAVVAALLTPYDINIAHIAEANEVAKEAPMPQTPVVAEETHLADSAGAEKLITETTNVAAVDYVSMLSRLVITPSLVERAAKRALKDVPEFRIISSGPIVPLINPIEAARANIARLRAETLALQAHKLTSNGGTEARETPATIMATTSPVAPHDGSASTVANIEGPSANITSAAIEATETKQAGSTTTRQAPTHAISSTATPAYQAKADGSPSEPTPHLSAILKPKSPESSATATDEVEKHVVPAPGRSVPPAPPVIASPPKYAPNNGGRPAVSAAAPVSWTSAMQVLMDHELKALDETFALRLGTHAGISGRRTTAEEAARHTLETLLAVLARDAKSRYQVLRVEFEKDWRRLLMLHARDDAHINQADRSQLPARHAEEKKFLKRLQEAAMPRLPNPLELGELAGGRQDRLPLWLAHPDISPSSVKSDPASAVGKIVITSVWLALNAPGAGKTGLLLSHLNVLRPCLSGRPMVAMARIAARDKNEIAFPSATDLALCKSEAATRNIANLFSSLTNGPSIGARPPSTKTPEK